jgi:hypothetical protein
MLTFQTKNQKEKAEQFIQNEILSINQSLENISDVIAPLDILRERLSRAEITKYQKLKFENIYTACLARENFEYVDDHSLEKSKYIPTSIGFTEDISRIL